MHNKSYGVPFEIIPWDSWDSGIIFVEHINAFFFAQGPARVPAYTRPHSLTLVAKCLKEFFDE